MDDLPKKCINSKRAMDKIKPTNSENIVQNVSSLTISSSSLDSNDLIRSPSLLSTNKSPSLSNRKMSKVTFSIPKKNATLEPVLVTNVEPIAVKSSQLKVY